MDFMSTLSEAPAPGHSFVISGRTTEDAKSMTISFTIAPVADSDIVFYFYVDFEDNKIMRSSIVGGAWTESDESPNVFGRGDDFQIQFQLHPERVHVIINDNVFCDYHTKLSVDAIKAIFIAGDVVRVTECDHMKIEPEFFPLVETDNKDIVFSSFIPSKVKPGHVVVLTGVASESSDGEFVIMFNENGKRIRQIVHLNVRFDERSVVANTMDDEHGSWGTEVRTSTFPFTLDEEFKLAMCFTEHEFKVAANGQYLLSYDLDTCSMLEGQFLYEMLIGLQVKVGRGMQADFTQVEYFSMESNCNRFENYSRL